MKKIILVGNPNTGKTTLFNKLTKSNAHTGNWHGVTVDCLTKQIELNGEKFEVVDLPGVYSLSPNSFEEKVAIEYILTHQNGIFVNVCNKNSLQQNLNLTLDLVEIGICPIVYVNDFSDVSKKQLNKSKLAKILGTKVVYNDEKLVCLKTEIKQHENKNLNINKKQYEEIEIVKKELNIKIYNPNNLNFFLKHAISGDEFYINKFKENNIEIIVNNDFCQKHWEDRIKTIDNILSLCLKNSNAKIKSSFLDKIVLNKFLCVPIFILIMTLIFYLTFFSVGRFFSDLISNFIQNDIKNIVMSFMLKNCSINWVNDLVSGAIIDGIGTVLSFLPQVVLLFVFLGIMEDSGYISRLAFCFDEIFKKVGLSGKSVYTLLMGFGCSTTACMTARNMSDKNAKIKTAMLTPYMSCSAKLPVYMVVGSAFFGAGNVGIILLLYLLGVIVALMLSSFYEKTYLKSKEQSFILEFPAYQSPSVKKMLKTVLSSSKNFIVRIASVIFALNVIVWILSNFSFNFNYTQSSSMLSQISKFIQPVFAPLGFNSWGVIVALLTGLVAKEMIISSITMLNASVLACGVGLAESITLSSSPVFFTPSSAIAFMVFCLLYCPCIASISALSKEIGNKWTIISVVVQFVIAYLCAMLCHLFSVLMTMFGAICVIVVSLIVIILIRVVYVSIKKLKKCSNCGQCRWIIM